jgi:probable phosphomutase (TIGR03848 family)
MAIVVLLRHGRTSSNTNGTLAGRTEVGLDEVGCRQADDLAGRLGGVPFARVVSSPLTRCRQTLARALPAVTPVPEPDLTECGYGDWEGRSLRTLVKDPLWRVVQQHPAGVTFPGAQGEAMSAMSARAVAAVRRHDQAVGEQVGPDAIWLACSHGDVIKAIVADALGLHLDQFQRIVVDPASLTVVRYTPGRPFLVRLNDTGGTLAALVPARKVRRRARRADADAVPGGGAGSAAGSAAR